MTTGDQRPRPAPTAVGRRRVLSLIAAAAGTAALPGTGLAGASLSGTRRDGVHEWTGVYEWKGQALGARARLLLAHPDPRACAEAAARCLDETARLERIFSLYDPDSELSRLNRDGRLVAASHDLRRVFAVAKRLGALSGGAFDPTVQPLWELYSHHFAGAPNASAGPPAAAVARARRLADYRGIILTEGGVAFARPGMKATLN
ncbi:MAG: FAD:protein FMN transferase, partial [Alphaproteobacteria bacterium]